MSVKIERIQNSKYMEGFLFSVDKNIVTIEEGNMFNPKINHLIHMDKYSFEIIPDNQYDSLYDLQIMYDGDGYSYCVDHIVLNECPEFTTHNPFTIAHTFCNIIVHPNGAFEAKIRYLDKPIQKVIYAQPVQSEPRKE